MREFDVYANPSQYQEWAQVKYLGEFMISYGSSILLDLHTVDPFIINHLFSEITLSLYSAN